MENEKLRILYATMEIDPFLRLTDAANFIKKLPKYLQEQGYEIRILMPKFGVINERRNRLHEVVRLSGINIRVGQEEKPLTIKVATIPNARLQVYFLDNEDYFLRKSVLTDPNSHRFHADNDERSIFFCKGVIETVKKLGWSPHIVHCHGWMTGLIPIYLRTLYKDDPVFKRSKILYTLYRDEYDFPLPSNFAEKARLHELDMAETHWACYRDLSEGGMQMADVVTRGFPESEALAPYLRAANMDVAYDNNGQDPQSYVEYYENLYQHMFGGPAVN